MPELPGQAPSLDLQPDVAFTGPSRRMGTTTGRERDSQRRPYSSASRCGVTICTFPMRSIV
jgi:hypothetical protein